MIPQQQQQQYSETRKNNLKLLVTEVKFLKISFNF